MSNQSWPDHFRYVDTIGPEGVSIICEQYVVIRETKHCYWIVSKIQAISFDFYIACGILPKCAKRVMKNSNRRFAYPDKAKALESYKARKRCQLRYAELEIERARTVLDEINDLSVIEDEHVCAGGDYVKGLYWD